MSDQKNLIIAIVLSVAILFGFQYFYEAPRIEQARQQQQAQQAAQPQATAPQPGAPPRPGEAPTAAPAAPGGPAAAKPTVSREAAIALTPRLKIDSRRLHGSIALTGGRIDDLTLVDYRTAVDRSSPEIVLLSPVGAPEPYYGEFGWVSAPGTAIKVPDSTTRWQADSAELTPAKPVTLTWDNGAGLRFTRTVAIDANYVFTITQQVENTTDQPVTLFPYGLISRHGTPKTLGFYILHEGPLGVLRDKANDAGTLKEMGYKDVAEANSVEMNSIGGWLGFTDKYWLTALVAPNEMALKARLSHTKNSDVDRYQVDLLGGAVEVAPKATAGTSFRLFAGAKEVQLIDRYENELGIPRFDRAIDWGWFYFLTKPIFFAIDYLNRLLGNFGLAILVFTVIVKVLFLPLAYKSYVSMSGMKKLQPEMMKLRERFGDDRQGMNKALMELYKREKVNPASGCLPILLQIPVFFALYKVLFVTIEMRHAPFYGWIKDLSAPDPTTWINLFGLIPWTPPTLGPLEILSIGVWPIIMGVSMWLQMKLNPTPPDPVQAKMFMLMPIVFTFMLGSFPAGLVIYWTWNNVLSIGQQWLIMKRMGVKHPAS